MKSVQFSFEAIGTQWKIDIFDNISSEKESYILKMIRERIENFDVLYSRFRTDSWINLLSQKASTYALPDDAEPMFSMYRDLAKITNGLMTPLIGQTLVDAGYDKDYSFTQTKPLTSPPDWDQVIQYDPVSVPAQITLIQPALLDVGAIGKGYLIDLVGEVLNKEGITRYCIDAGGDILHKNSDSSAAPIRIGLEHPQDVKKVIGILTVQNKSIAGSAGNRRAWGKFNHVINPKTLSSPENILATWAVADTAMLADAMSTALYFSSAQTLLERYQFEYLILYKDMSVEGNLINNPMLELY